MSNLPIWAKPAPGSRKPRFTREQIASAALEVADKHGFAELSMRRVADALGAGTMTLYYYVRTKDDLLALMEDALMGEVVARCTPLPEHWRTALETISNAMRTVFLEHPWALDVDGVRVGPHTLMHIEQSLAAVKQLSIPLTAKFEMLAVVDDFVFGSVLRDRVGPQAGDLSVDVINQLTREHLKTGHFPILEAMIADRNPVDVFVEFASYATAHGRFDRGLAVVLDGFAAKYGLSNREKRVKPARRRAR